MIIVMLLSNGDADADGRRVLGLSLRQHLVNSAGRVPGVRVWDSKLPLPAGEDVAVIDHDVWLSHRLVKELVLMSGSSEAAVALMERASLLNERPIALWISRRNVEAGAASRALHATDVRDALADAPPARRLSADALGGPATAFRVDDAVAMAELERRVLHERACDAIRNGVMIRDPESVFIRGGLRCAPGVSIDHDVIFEGDVEIGAGSHVGPFCVVKNSALAANVRVNAYSHVENARVGANTFIGPYGRLRPGTSLGENVQVGNFVEIKNAAIADGCRINHLAFVGDATLGPRVTIGAGSITCNHDGRGSVRTTIDEGAYVGSGCELVAPLHIGAHAMIAAGSTVTEDAAADALTIARARQVTIRDWIAPVSRPPRA